MLKRHFINTYDDFLHFDWLKRFETGLKCDLRPAFGQLGELLFGEFNVTIQNVLNKTKARV